MTNDEAAKILSSFSVDDTGEISRNYWYKEIQKDTEEAINLAVKALKQQKTAHWKRRIVDNGNNADWVCSECGFKVMTNYVSYNYCPNCGAKMVDPQGSE